jgi:hypothetical protein
MIILINEPKQVLFHFKNATLITIEQHNEKSFVS